MVKVTPPPVGTSPKIRGGRFLPKAQQFIKPAKSNSFPVRLSGVEASEGWGE